jgi:imidazolonepropionase-like amidohydrolase
LTPKEVLEMSTLNGALALGRAGQLGEISAGSIADLVAFPHEEDMGTEVGDPYGRVVESHASPSLLLVDGHPVKF